MIKLFNSTETEFLSNGIKILKPSKCKMGKEDNNDYFIEVEDTIDNIDYYIKGNILFVPSPTGEQAFRIDNPIKKNNKITCKAYHVFYDSANYVIEDSNIVDKNCNYAMDHLNTMCDRTTPFTTSSDITSVKSFRPVRKSLEKAFNNCLEMYGGHLVRDNFNVSINSTIGQDRGIALAYSKNITEIEAKENWDNVCTKILPTTTYNNKVYMLPEKWLFSDIQYDEIYAKVIEFDNELDEENYKDADDNVDIEKYENDLLIWLRNKATTYLQNNNKPLVNYTLKAHLKDVSDVGDTIRVHHQKLNIDLITHVLSFTYDCIQEKFIEIEFGNFKPKLSNLVTNFETKLNETKKEINKQTTSFITNEINSASSKILNDMNGYNIYDKSRMLAMDTDDITTAQTIMMINKSGILFTDEGINGQFKGLISSKGEIDFQNVKALNMLASMIKCDNLKVGGIDNQSGNIELQDESGKTIAIHDKEGTRYFTNDGGTLKINPIEGIAFYNSSNTKNWWADGDIFHTKKFEATDEFTLATCRQLPINTDDNIGIGFVSLV